MTAAGCAPGQIGSHPNRASAVFCSSADQFRTRFPAAACVIEPSDDPGACTDLNVYATVGEAAHIDEAHFDGVEAEVLLRGLGRERLAEEARALTSLPLPEGGARLAGYVREILPTGPRAAAETVGQGHD